MAVWSREALEKLAEQVLEAYFALPGAPDDRVDPWVLGRQLLGLRVEYRRLSRDGGLLGLTAAAHLWVRVWDRPGAWEQLDGRTVLLDEHLASPWASPGRRNFTLAHEIAHQLLCRAAPEAAAAPLCCRAGSFSWEEWRADVLASALLMPEKLIVGGMRRCGLPPSLRVPDPRLDPAGWRRFGALAESLGVSRQALSLRLRRLGYLQRDWRPRSRSRLDIAMEEDELCQDST